VGMLSSDAGCESEAEALTRGGRLALASVPALTGLRSGFSRFGLFQEILRVLFVNLGRN
jgi:hypothetical protein